MGFDLRAKVHISYVCVLPSELDRTAHTRADVNGIQICIKLQKKNVLAYLAIYNISRSRIVHFFIKFEFAQCQVVLI